tara:strand:+ start:2653 stop:3288 length:636 start_codon:yes stop_codon:yes gene_type:complete
MSQILRNKIDPNFIREVNQLIDKISYERSLFIFSKKKDLSQLEIEIINKIKSFIPAIKEDLNIDTNDDPYIVIRCVKKIDSKMSFTPHFDNYSDTILIPLMVPSKPPYGELFLQENSRKQSNSMFWDLLRKFIYQNIFTAVLIKNFFLKYFSAIHILPGDAFHFNGYKSLHFNNNCSSERRSILIHMNLAIKDTQILNLFESLVYLTHKKN